jgi:membrane-associated phospholipid phosphatase
LITLTACVGLSRIALGVHFPGDVLCGSILGATIGLLGARFHRARVTRGAEQP